VSPMTAPTGRQPYADFAALRRQGPVVCQRGLDGQDERYLALTHDAVAQVLRDHRSFSSANYRESIGVVLGPTMLEMDEPHHSRHRRLVQSAFERAVVSRWDTRIITPIVNALIDRFQSAGRADLVRQLTFPFSIHVISQVLGLPKGDLATFHTCALDLIGLNVDRKRALESGERLGRLLSPIIAQRRRDPEEDLISKLVTAESDGGLDDRHALAFIRLLLPAGAETTYRAASNCLLALLSNADQLEAVRSDLSLLPQVIDESLRWEAPLTGILRTCVRDTEVAGVLIPAGAQMQVKLGSANHDEARYHEPGKFDVFRGRKAHMSFAAGPHYCLGAQFAVAEISSVVTTVLARLRGVRFDPAAETPRVSGYGYRAPQRLSVVFDV
jgi:cytochrome P450